VGSSAATVGGSCVLGSLYSNTGTGTALSVCTPTGWEAVP
jgi:hypothetical protein